MSEAAAIVGVEPWDGRTRAVIIGHSGPTSYVAGGEKLGQGAYGGPNIFGLAGFYFIAAGVTYSGTYRVDCMYGGKGVRQSVKLKWTVISTGQEVTNGVDLSGEYVRLLALGG